MKIFFPITTVTIEYLTSSGDCKCATGILSAYRSNGDVYIIVNGRRKKGTPVEWTRGGKSEEEDIKKRYEETYGANWKKVYDKDRAGSEILCVF